MKSNNFGTKALFVLLVFLTITVSVSGISLGAEPEDMLNIAGCNLSFESDTHLMYAVKSADPNVKLLVWLEPQSNYIAGSEDAELAPQTYRETIGDTDYTVFKYTGLAAKQMTDDVYVRAYIPESDGNHSYGTVYKYSILQYAYNKLGKTGRTTSNENLISMLFEMLDFGAAAQKYNEYKTDRLATDTFVEIKLSEGTLPDGFNKGLYKVGDNVSLKAPSENSQGVAFTAWKDEFGNTLSNTAEYALTVDNVNNSYHPEYIAYSEGLVFESEGDGTCYLIDIGDCTDKDVKIPSKSPDGDTVIGIDGAFDGAAITSVSIPSTVEEIGRRSFRDCTELTDVYYEGSESDFANISISSGNDPVENASLHFSKSQAYKVIFVDHNGKVLKGEMVKSGESATAPAAIKREGYSFDGFSTAFDNVTGNITTKAIYKYISTTPTIHVETVTVDKGTSEVSVKVSIINNPGIMNMVVAMNIDDDALLFKSATKGDALPSATLTSPGALQINSPYKFLLDAQELTSDDKVDGVLFTLVFTIKDTSAIGEYNITFSYNERDIVNETLMPFEINIEDGKIIIK